MTISANPPSSLISNHPPLAHDAQGCKLGVPDGTTHWRLLRHTAGRPKVVLGSDMQPARFSLELTHEQLLELCGPGKYRIEALDPYGNALACVSTVTVGGLGADAPVATELVANGNARASATNDMRFALETIAQLSRAQSESLQSLATAQADWIKTLATAKQLPRNGFAPAAAPQVPVDATPDGQPPASGWFALLEPAMPAIATALLRNLGAFLGRKQEEPAATPRRNASGATHVARIRARLPPGEQRLLDEVILDDADGEQLVATLVERDVDSATALVRGKINASPKRNPVPNFDQHAAAICALLAPAEREVGIQMIRTISPFVSDTLVRMTPQQGAELVRRLLVEAATVQQVEGDAS